MNLFSPALSPRETNPVTGLSGHLRSHRHLSIHVTRTGKELDGRSDIFSLGSVLYEMLTGQRAFPGKSRLSVASAILEKEPASIASLKPMTPPALDHVIRRSLAKDPDDRWQTARDLELELKWTAETGPQSSRPTPAIRQRELRERLAWTSSVGMAIAVLGLFIYFQHRSPISSATAQDAAAFGQTVRRYESRSTMPRK
jgi:serine/threonine protein kinase